MKLSTCTVLISAAVLMHACKLTDETPVADFDDATVRKMALEGPESSTVWEPHLAISSNGATVTAVATYGDRLDRLYSWAGSTLDNWIGKRHEDEETGSLAAGDPVVQFGQGNTCFYTYLYDSNDANAGPSIKLVRSEDGGKTFPHATLVVNYEKASGNISTSPDKEWLAVDRLTNTIYVAWSEFVIDTDQLSPNNPAIVKLSICLSRSIDGGETFLPYQVIDSTLFTGQAMDVHVLQLVTDQQGTVHLVWRDPVTARLFHSYSVDRGVTFSSKVPVAPAPPPSLLESRPLPSLAVTESNQLVVAWVSKDIGPKEFVEYAVYNNTSWSAPQRMANAPLVDQSCPAIASGSDAVYIQCFEVEDKKVSVVLYKSEDLTVFRKVHTFATRSFGYTNFETDTKPEELLTGNTFRPGDYVGLAAHGNTVWSAYTLPVTSSSVRNNTALYIGRYED